MTHIQRYVLAETFKVFLVAIVATTILMTVGVGVNEGVKQGLPLSVSFGLMLFVIPESLRMTVPAALLFSVCTVVGRMAADGEITAAKSLGIHPFRLFAPVLWMAYFLSIGTFVMYEISAGWGRPNLRQAVISAIDEVAYRILKTDRVMQAQNTTISVKDVVGDKLIRPSLRIEHEHGDSTIAEASEATLTEVGETGRLRIACVNVTFQRQQFDGGFPGDFHYDIPFTNPADRDHSGLSPAELRASMLDGQIAYEQRQLAALRELQRERGADQSERREVRGRTLRLRRLQAELPRRMSNGFAAFAFAMIGIPVAAWSESKDNTTVFFLCIVPILIVFYPLLMLGEQLARAGIWPQVTVWLPPAALTLVGAVLIQKLVRH